MFDSKSPAVKICGYAVIGFFLLIIIISFGMPNIMPQAGMETTAAVVNGKKLNIIDFLRFRDSILEQAGMEKDKSMDSMILDRFIAREVTYQYAQDIDLDASSDRITSLIRNWFRDSDTGAYNPEKLKNYLQRSNQNFQSFENTVRQDMAINDLQTMIYTTTAVPSSDVKKEFECNNTKIQIKYSVLSRTDLKKKFASGLEVSDAEIEAEMKANPAEMKDPENDKKRVKEQLVQKKLEAVEKELIQKIDETAAAKGSFAAAQNILKGKTGFSKEFTPGGQILDSSREGRPVALLESSSVFRESCLALEPGVTSKAISTAAGIYIFTPVMKKAPVKAPSEEELAGTEQDMKFSMANSTLGVLSQTLFTEAEIKKNIKITQ